MRCPFCESEETKVIDSRHTEEGNAIRRRRECEQCGKRFTTYEKIEEITLIVIKKDGEENHLTEIKYSMESLRHVRRDPCPCPRWKGLWTKLNVA